VSDPAVSLERVGKRFGDLVAVRDLELDIEQGEFFSLIGPSGCGKTTTLRMVAGFEDPSFGLIRVAGRDMSGVRPYRRPVNTVFQSYALFPHLDVFENIAFSLREARRPRAEIRERVGEAIALVQLEGRERARPRQLSGGQQQRVALARALVSRPAVLLLDEPLGALDLKLRTEMQGQLKDLQRAVGITFCYVTHDQSEAFSMSDRVGVMNRGVLEQVGAPEDVYRHPQTSFVADFVGAANRLAASIVGVEGRRYRIAVDGLGERLAAGPEGLSAGTRAMLVIRPEDVRLRPADAAAGSLRATVADVAFLGSQRLLRLESRAAGPLASVGSGHDSPLERGAEVGLEWDDAAAWVVPEADPEEPDEA
jgi:spermidine/putrescine transport system ATP-binding protein